MSCSYLQKRIPETETIFTYILLSDILNSICRETINLFIEDKEDKKVGAVASAVLFVLIPLLFFGPLVIIHVRRTAQWKTSGDCRIHIMFVTIQSAGVILYYFGNNSLILIRKYRHELDCDSRCFDLFQVIAALSLGGALAYFQIVPSCCVKIAKMFDYNLQNAAEFSVGHMITVYVKIDALFNTISLTMRTYRDACSATTLLSIFMALCIILGHGVTWVNFIEALRMFKKSNNNWRGWKLFEQVTFLVLLSVFFTMYMVTDNIYPLNCAFNCYGNLSFPAGDCSTKISGIRLSFSSVIFVTVILVSLILFIYKRKATNGKIEGSYYFQFQNKFPLIV